MKSKLKPEIFEKRKALSKEEVSLRSERIKERLYSLGEFKKAKNIMIYVSFNNEADTMGIIGESLKNKEKAVLVPYVNKDKLLQISKINSFDDLEPKTFGILEPKEGKIRKFDAEKLDLVIVPGIAFDRRGHRIGYGKGHYDRFLENLPKQVKKIALAFDFQLIEKIPEEKHDVAMDIIITEKEIIKCH